MLFVAKLVVTVGVIVISSQIGRKFPSLAGLIATMPLTGLMVLLWLYAEDPSDSGLMVGYARGALFGIVPSIMFFLTAWLCFRSGMGLGSVLLASFGVWAAGAVVHQIFLGKRAPPSSRADQEFSMTIPTGQWSEPAT